ncbi:anaerobic ribonucleoside-triphosphate reductase activating protein [Desulfuromonas versatilis]|uniref:Anaerobic ribonucleoside-triphosphate reductase activating protein n=1 Tax=Desulfuromonas versatilis TaxID=2802975 RepID=A0ABN6DWA4_9BACT|nr:anaerobic ribonucleoside-triphosphate reductase activating protein [Desulfuromonas versatilis]BCR03789.1 anaerobic ribonucleoside-triphosphate reductase activating protein [Desulfuromonas versatilis]
MGVKGFQGTSLLDYPGKIASLVFFGGCNLTCPFCHNPSLVLAPGELPDYPLTALLEDLRERRRFIDGVVVTGGEPTLDPDLLPLLREIRKLDLRIKIDTNGLAPQVLRRALAEGLVDYLAMDLKTSPGRYGELHRAPVAVADLQASAAILRESGIQYEFRTTCVPGYVEAEDIQAMGALIQGAELWVLQQFEQAHSLDEGLRGVEQHPVAKLGALAELAGSYVRSLKVRGIEP